MYLFRTTKQLINSSFGQWPRNAFALAAADEKRATTRRRQQKLAVRLLRAPL
jgi:hypothetical protein